MRRNITPLARNFQLRGVWLINALLFYCLITVLLLFYYCFICFITVQHLKNRKRKLWNIYIQSQDVISYSRFSHCKNNLRRLPHSLHQNYEQNLVSNMKYKPKTFCCYAGSRLKSHTEVEDCCTEGGNLTSNDQEKAGVLNRFCSVRIYEDPEDIPVPASVYDGPMVDNVDITITVGLIGSKLAQLKPSFAAGPDEIHPWVLCETADTISVPHHHIQRILVLRIWCSSARLQACQHSDNL